MILLEKLSVNKTHECIFARESKVTILILTSISYLCQTISQSVTKVICLFNSLNFS